MSWFNYIFSIVLIFGLGSFSFKAVTTWNNTEDCENGKDDDMDGWIDLNDPDCECRVAEPISLIPNPSFEEQKCCPSSRSQLSCAETWIQASEATTDYIHTCGWMGWENLPVPLPFPDGSGCIGFRDGRFGNDPEPNWKEYTGACLNAPLKAGTSYRFKFHVGFTNAYNSPGLHVTFFGSKDCKNLPFGIGNSGFGCPTNGPGWMELGKVWVNGANEWIEYSLTFTPTEDMYAIAIGPNCPELDITRTADTYYFFDNLILDDRRNFEYKITAQNHPCSAAFSLNVPMEEGLRYQWYKDGVAIVGETEPFLRINRVEGDYQAMLKNGNSCWLTPIFTYKVPIIYTDIDVVTCPNEAFEYYDKSYYKAGIYLDTLQSYFGCDSVVAIHLTVAENEFTMVDAKIFEDEKYEIGKIHFEKSGTYKVNFQTIYGCDSLVQLNLDYYKVYFPNAFSPNGDEFNDIFTVAGNNDLKAILSFRIFNRWGEIVYDEINVPDESGSKGWDGNTNKIPAPNGIYVYTTILLMNDNQKRTRQGTFLLVR